VDNIKYGLTNWVYSLVDLDVRKIKCKVQALIEMQCQ
jgi:hypothetical protein